MFTDERRAEVWQQLRDKGIRCFQDLLSPQVLAEAAVRTRRELIVSPLSWATLVWLGIAAAMHRTESFAGILTLTLKVLQDQPGFAASEIGTSQRNGRRKKQAQKRSKHDPRRNDPTLVTEEAFVQARARMPMEFWANLIVLLVEKFLEEHRSRVLFRGFRVLTIDGTTINLPNWKALREHFGTPTNGTGRHAAQARLVMVQFPFVRLPYRYALTPLAEGEIPIARRLIAELEANDLLLMDAGYFSYGLFCDLQKRQAFFAIRLPRRMNFRTVRKLGRHDRLVVWTPKDSRRQWRKEDLPPAIKLRVIEYRVPGFRPQSIVTNVLDPEQVPREDWVRLTTDCHVGGRFRPGLFHRRWEIETTYRELKVDQGLEGHLRSRTPDSIKWEVSAHIVLYLLVRWLMVEAAAKHNLDPLQLSFLNALRELLAMQQSLMTAEGRWLTTLYARLLERVASHQVPRRPGRHYPRRKTKTPSANHQPKAIQT